MHLGTKNLNFFSFPFFSRPKKFLNSSLSIWRQQLQQQHHQHQQQQLQPTDHEENEKKFESSWQALYFIRCSVCYSYLRAPVQVHSWFFLSFKSTLPEKRMIDWHTSFFVFLSESISPSFYEAAFLPLSFRQKIQIQTEGREKPSIRGHSNNECQFLGTFLTPYDIFLGKITLFNAYRLKLWNIKDKKCLLSSNISAKQEFLLPKAFKSMFWKEKKGKILMPLCRPPLKISSIINLNSS